MGKDILKPFSFNYSIHINSVILMIRLKFLSLNKPIDNRRYCIIGGIKILNKHAACRRFRTIIKCSTNIYK